jgi:NTP pyrophosphatase (non-canonical NTP hydrolase)
VKVLVDIAERVDRNTERWDDQAHQTPAEWLTVLAEEFGEVAAAAKLAQFGPPPHAPSKKAGDLYGELIDLAAVCIQWADVLPVSGRSPEEKT